MTELGMVHIIDCFLPYEHPQLTGSKVVPPAHCITSSPRRNEDGAPSTGLK